MAKTTAPLLSFGADGQIARTAVYARWKGVPYVRRYVIPANPRTTRQTVTRNLFRKLQRMWLIAPPALKAPFEANAEGRPYLPVNKFTGLNTSGLDTQSPPADMDFFQGSPGARGGLPPISLVLAPTTDTLTATLAAPVIPDDWTINSAVAVAFKNQSPTAEFEGVITSASDAASPYEVALTGLDGGEEYVVSAWFVWNRPDGKLAYSVSLTDTATPTA